MPKVFVVCLPPGMGKTRLVLKEGILKGAGHSLKKWNLRLKKTIILVPNDNYAKQAWIRELLILGSTGKERFIDLDENKIRRMKTRALANTIKKSELVPPIFYTFSDLANHRMQTLRCHNRWICQYLIIDEWHHIWPKVGRYCEAYLDGGKANPWYIGGKNVSKKIFFVSATPVNPTLEQEEENENPLDDEKFLERVKEAIARTRKILQAFAGRKNDVRKRKFFEILGELGGRTWPSETRIARTVHWVVPKSAEDAAEHFREKDIRSRELDTIKTYLDVSSGNHQYQKEYAYTVGLIRTRYSRKKHDYFILKGKRGKQSCFGFPYSVLHFPEKTKTRSAVKWLFKEQGSVKRLVNILLNEKVLEKKETRIVIGKKKKKALVFCTHRGVAMGLVKTLKWFLQDEAKYLSPSDRIGLIDIENAIAYDGEKSRVEKSWSRQDYTETLVNGFNEKKGNPIILIATDKLSESLDLHESCKLIIHYELPWSPLRLFQRVGRLTRLKAWGERTVFNKGVRVGHIIVPGSVAEERVNRLIRRILFLSEEHLWPKGVRDSKLILGLIGNGPSLHLKEYLMQLENLRA
jgi:hypothetical protein